MSIFIAEDNAMALKSILMKLAPFEDIAVVKTLQNGEDLVKAIDSNEPDVVLMDIEMPVMDGIEATKNVKSLYPNVKVIMLTTFDDDDKIFNAILSGASGYLTKDESAANIYRSIRDVYEGGAAMTSGIALKALNYIKKSNNKFDAEKSILSQREIEVLQGLKDGLGYKQIASKLFISEGTIRKHIEHIYRKLQVNNKVSAINVASLNNWL